MGENRMNQVKFGIRFTVNDYAYSELSNFIECTDNLDGEQNLSQRYIDFLNALLSKQVKPSTLVDVDVLRVFADDLDNRAHIDFLEGHWDDDPDIVKGGEMFYGRYNKLKQIHGEILA